jgi:hypothetical protein
MNASVKGDSLRICHSSPPLAGPVPVNKRVKRFQVRIAARQYEQGISLAISSCDVDSRVQQLSKLRAAPQRTRGDCGTVREVRHILAFLAYHATQPTMSEFPVCRMRSRRLIVSWRRGVAYGVGTQCSVHVHETRHQAWTSWGGFPQAAVTARCAMTSVNGSRTLSIAADP